MSVHHSISAHSVANSSFTEAAVSLSFHVHVGTGNIASVSSVHLTIAEALEAIAQLKSAVAQAEYDQAQEEARHPFATASRELISTLPRSTKECSTNQ